MKAIGLKFRSWAGYDVLDIQDMIFCNACRCKYAVPNLNRKCPVCESYTESYANCILMIWRKKSES